MSEDISSRVKLRELKVLSGRYYTLRLASFDYQRGDGQWQRGKSCDTFAPMGQTIVTTDEILDPHTLRISLTVNGTVMQDSSTSQLIFRVPELIGFITASITLEPGDVIATGTPAGVGFARKPPVFLKPGDRMEVSIDRIGRLGNSIVASPVARQSTPQAASPARDTIPFA